MRVVPATVLWREDERAGGGDGSHVPLGEERYGGPGGHAEQGGGGVGPPVAGGEGGAGGVAEGAGRHGDGLARRILLRVALGGDLLAGSAHRTQLLLRLVLGRGSAGGHACSRGDDGRPAVHGAGG